MAASVAGNVACPSPLDRASPLSFVKAVVLKRDRNLGQQVLEVAVAAFEKRIPMVLRPDPGFVSRGGGARSASPESSHPR
jgi:hypothetical protein